MVVEVDIISLHHGCWSGLKLISA